MTPVFEVTARDSQTQARVGRLTTPHGVVETPTFMPVGTQGTVKTLSVPELKACGAQMILGNVYHLSLRPGQKALEIAGGLHRFMAWDGPILTDSGGYQVFSLATRAKVSDEGVTFASHIDGSRHTLTPENVIDFQWAIGSDVVIPLDQCVAYPCERQEAEAALNRTQAWAERSKERFDTKIGTKSENRYQVPRNPLHSKGLSRPSVPGTKKPLLFGIVQGATYKDLRLQAVERLLPIDFDGYCLGGLSVGEPKGLMYELVPEVARQLPEAKPRYLMGMGEPMDLIQAVKAGVDLFDCVVPTRHGRNGIAYTWAGRINLKNAVHTNDPQPVDPACDCWVCKTHSRMYLRHLFQAGEMLGLRLLSFHNIWFYSKLMSTVREALVAGDLKHLSRRIQSAYQPTLEVML